MVDYTITSGSEASTVNLYDALAAARRLKGVVTAAVLDVDTGLDLARSGDESDPFTTARRRRLAFRMFRENIEALEHPVTLEEILFRDGPYFHLFHFLPADPTTGDCLCLHLTLAGDIQNLAFVLTRIEELVSALTE